MKNKVKQICACIAALSVCIGLLQPVVLATNPGSSSPNAQATMQTASEMAVPAASEHSHVYNDDPTFTWSADHSTCTASFACTKCGAVVTSDCNVTKQTTTEPTCTKEGTATYTATAIFNGLTYTDTVTAPIAKLDHTYGEPDFVWSSDHTSCDAVFTCSVCAEATTVGCTVTSQTNGGSCTEGGSIVHTATVEYNGTVYTDKMTDIIEATAHTYNAPTFTWSDDNSSCTAAFVCSVCGDAETVNCTVTDVTTQPTCTEDGTTVYTASATLDSTNYTDTKTVIIPAVSHAYNEPTFTWSDDNSSCNAVFTCSVCEQADTVACDVTSRMVDASCTEGGSIVYTATVEHNGTVYTDTATGTVEATGHTYGEPAFTWSDDNSSCTAAFVCSVCGDAQSVNCTVTDDTTQPTCTEDGTTVYTASATLDDTDYTNTQTVVIPATGHTYDEPVFTWSDDNSSCTAMFVCSVCGDAETVNCTITSDTTQPTCTDDGVTVYTASATLDGTEYPDTKTAVIPAIGHTYDEPVFTWSDDNSSCTAVFVCSVCGDTVTINCTVTNDTTQPTCTEDGTTVYTASATLDDTDYTDTKTVIIPAVGHAYDKPVFTWSDDNSSCTAVFVCSVCGDTQTVDCTVTGNADDGYTATCEYNGTTYSAVNNSTVITAISLDKQSISLTAGETDTLTVLFEPANTTADKTITWSSSDELIAAVENGEITAVSAGTAIITAATTSGLTATCTVTVAAADTTPVDQVFTDVSSGSWYYDAVQFVYDNGLMSGTSSTTFSPAMTTSRAMVVQILYNNADKPPVSGAMPFSDVNAGSWYYDAVLWAYNTGVSSGDGKGNFRPTANVTREQFAQFLYNVEGAPSVSGSIAFSDADSVSSWAKDAILWATQEGIINGSKSGETITLNPKGQASRAEVAAMLKNYLE